jgi:hypothetical protein
MATTRLLIAAHATISNTHGALHIFEYLGHNSGLAGSRSCSIHGMPYLSTMVTQDMQHEHSHRRWLPPYPSRIRVRNASAAKASGPTTPAPAHARVASSSSAMTGLNAVCHTTHWQSQSRMLAALSATW